MTFKERFKEIDWQQDIMQYLYLVLFVGITIKYYFLSAAVGNRYSYGMYNVLKWILAGVVVVNIGLTIYYKRYDSWVQIVFLLVFIGIGTAVTYHTGDVAVMDLTLLIVGAWQTSWKKIAYSYLCIAILFQIVLLICIQTGVGWDIIYTSDRGVRHSFGINYPTDFAAHILFIEIVYVAYRNKKISFVELAGMAVVALFVYRYTFARNDSLCMLLLCGLTAIVKLLQMKQIYLSKLYVMKIGGWLFFGILLVLILGVTLYDSTNPFWQKLDDFMTNRIALSYQGLVEYQSSLLGSYVEEQNTVLGYSFFLDSSYIRMIIRNGWLFTALMSYVYFRLYQRVVHRHQDYMMIACIVMVIFGVVEHHMIEIAYCPLWMMLLSRIPVEHSHKRRDA